MVDPLKAELGPRAWNDDVEDWMRRARRGVGVEGRLDSRTAYFWGERSWGGRIAGPCPKPKPPKEDKPPKEGPPDPGDPPGPPGGPPGQDPTPTPKP
jgi:hypothetical protein